MDEETGFGNLHHAVVERFTNLVQSLLEQGEEQVNMPDNQGKTPLHLVCSKIEGSDMPLFLKCESEYLPCRTLKETKKIIELLLCHGADLNILDKSGKTALHCLVDHWLTKVYPIEHFKEILTQFLHCGFNLNCKDGNGRTVVHYVAGSAHMNVPRASAPDRISDDLHMMCSRHSRLLRPKDKKNDKVSPEDQLYRKEFLVALLNNGADMNSADNMGFTPLHLAIAANQFDVVNELLVGKPVLNVQNSQGQTPLHYAVSTDEKFKQCGILLLHKGALASTVDNRACSPFRFAKNLQEFSMFLKHLILLMNVKIHPEMEIGNISSNRIKKLREECMRECQDLNAYFEQNGQSQLHVILQYQRLPVYTENYFFSSKIISLEFQTRFPNYSHFLKYKFFQDKNRMKMIDKCTSVFSCFGGSFQYSDAGRLVYSRNTHWEVLPILAKLQILSYLSNVQLEYLEKHL